jgi:acetoin utilization deacetylase AcuC-like enzyme
MGFCLFNNVAIGANHALEHHGIERVAIVDFDVHHGNGTEDIFSDDERVVMASIFQHPFYPYSGTEDVAPNMANVPLPAGSDGRALRAAVERVWMPALEELRPQMIFVSRPTTAGSPSASRKSPTSTPVEGSSRFSREATHSRRSDGAW